MKRSETPSICGRIVIQANQKVALPFNLKKMSGCTLKRKKERKREERKKKRNTPEQHKEARDF